jgi:Na+/melibiose symporter-like transporter
MMPSVVSLYFQCISFGFDLCKVEEHLETEKESTAKIHAIQHFLAFSKNRDSKIHITITHTFVQAVQIVGSRMPWCIEFS